MRKVEPHTSIFVQDQGNLTLVSFTTVLPFASREGYASTEVEQKVVNLSPSLARGWAHWSYEKESSEHLVCISSLYTSLNKTRWLKTTLFSQQWCTGSHPSHSVSPLPQHTDLALHKQVWGERRVNSTCKWTKALRNLFNTFTQR